MLDGVYVNFENVGGEVMWVVLLWMVIGGCVVLCGVILNYNSGCVVDDVGVLILKWLMMCGFLIFDYCKSCEVV